MSEEIKRHREVLKEEIKSSKGICGFLKCSDGGWCDKMECDLHDAFEALLKLADSYLAVKGFPELKTQFLTKDRLEYQLGICEGRKRMLHLCRVAHLKEMEMKETFIEIAKTNRVLEKELAQLKSQLKGKWCECGDKCVDTTYCWRCHKTIRPQLKAMPTDELKNIIIKKLECIVPHIFLGGDKKLSLLQRTNIAENIVALWGKK